MAQLSKRKEVSLDPRANKEFIEYPRIIQLKFKAAFELLSRKGLLTEPLAKKLSGQKNLFEIRISLDNEYRAIYCYFPENRIIILSTFPKKSQKTPHKEIEKAIKRQKEYL